MVSRDRIKQKGDRGVSTVHALIKKFLKGKYGKTLPNLSSRDNAVTCDREGNKLPAILSYQTPIAVRIDGDTIAVNPNHYSLTSTRHVTCVTDVLYLCGFAHTEREWTPHGKEGRYCPETGDPFVIYTREGGTQ